MKTLDEIKYETIVQRLVHFKGNRTLTAKTLGISTVGLRNSIATIRKDYSYLSISIPPVRDNSEGFWKTIRYGINQTTERGYIRGQSIYRKTL